MQVNKKQLDLDMEQQISSKLGKEYFKAAYCHPTYLSYMQHASCEMLDWLNHNLESRLPGKMRNIYSIRYADNKLCFQQASYNFMTAVILEPPK